MIFDKYSVKSDISNDSSSIISLLIDSPVIFDDDSDHVAGYAFNIEHRVGGLFFGDINLFSLGDENLFSKIQITSTELVYDGVSNNPITITGFITHIKKISNENQDSKE